uniref:Ig-like domain-containing protein n=1 Tax=Labrus bergylta TaxID=56723 RepID=A0A3Q3FX28_9LABR
LTRWSPWSSSVKLSCNAVYNFKLCGWLHVVWCWEDVKMTEPRKYFTTVNETISGRNMRLRQVVTEILDLTSEDDGRYYCTAECLKSQDGAVGQSITIEVKGTDEEAESYPLCVCVCVCVCLTVILFITHRGGDL